MPQREEAKSRWETAGLRIGVISSGVGLVVAIVGLPSTVVSALKGENSDQPEVELRQKRAEAAAAAPRLDVKYLILSTSVLPDQTGSSRNKATKRVATLAASAPVIANEISSRDDTNSLFGRGAGCYAAYPATSITYLEVDNRGRRDAANVVVVLDSLKLRERVRIREAARGGDDYVAKIRSSSTGARKVTVRIPRTLGPGEGVRVPLFVSDAPYESYDRWCVISRSAYLPRSVTFSDPALGTTTHVGVRRMQSPLVIGPGAFERG